MLPKGVKPNAANCRESVPTLYSVWIRRSPRCQLQAQKLAKNKTTKSTFRRPVLTGTRRAASANMGHAAATPEEEMIRLRAIPARSDITSLDARARRKTNGKIAWLANPLYTRDANGKSLKLGLDTWPQGDEKKEENGRERRCRKKARRARRPRELVDVRCPRDVTLDERAERHRSRPEGETARLPSYRCRLLHRPLLSARRQALH